MEELTQYIKADFAVLVAVLYCIGRGLKAIQRFPNQFIPLALTFCGIGLACLSVVSRYASYGNWQPLCLKVWCRVSCVRACQSI